MNKKSCIKKVLYISLIFIISFIFLTGCGSKNIELEQKELSLQKGESYQLTKKDTLTVIYKSSDPNIVYVNEVTGYLEARRAGTVTITVYEKGNESNKVECIITVTAPTPTPPKVFTLTYDANGGSVNPTNKSITNGQKFGDLPTPTREGYKFIGWYSQAEGGNKVSENTIMIADKTIYAHWSKESTPTPIEVEFTLTFDANGGSVSPTSKKIKKETAFGELPTPVREGYKFTGWYTEKSGGGKVTEKTIITGDFTVYAHWKKKEDPAPTIKKVNILNKAAKAYFSDSSRKILNICSNQGCGKKLSCDDPAEYKSSISGKIKIYSYNTKTREKKLIKTVSSNLNYYLLPGNTYYLESASDAKNNEYIRIEKTLRMVNIPGVGNVRDLGGWKADGGTIKYGRIYRSANPNKGNDSTSPSLKEVGINLIVDLRGKTSDSKPVNYSGLEHKYISVGSYSPNANNIRKAVREIMANVVNGKNVLFHCAIGTDRTGTVAFLLEGILGVSKSNLYDDYELSTFYLYKSITNRIRTNSNLKKLYNEMNKYGSNDQEKFINWFITTSKDKENDIKLINNFRKVMIDGSPKTYKLSGGKAVIG